MAEHKRQHYVPQLYLRNFSDNHKTITVYSINERKIVTNHAPIDRQCYQNYMYSENLDFEKAITGIENATKIIIDSIIKEKKLPKISTDNFFTLTVFILYQSARTLFSAEQLNETIDNLAKNILEDHIKIAKPEDITIEDLKKAKIQYKQPALFSLGVISQMIPLTLDLEYKLIINQTNINFITSDNPVVFYNKYYLKDFFNYTGIACKGLLIIFPLTPKLMVIYFDSNMYKIGGKKLSTNVTLNKELDVKNLNILQFLNANKTIYPYNLDSNYLNELSKIALKFKQTKKSNIFHTAYSKHEDGTESKLIGISKHKILYDVKLSFLIINKKIPEYYLKQRLVRDPQLVELHQEFLDKMKEGKYKASEWNLFIRSKI